MSDLPVNAALVGRKVRNPARPEWGDGEVLRVQATTVGGQPVHRVSVQFVTGHRMLVVPPARLVEPAPEQQRAAGWLDTLGKRTLDDRLVNLPVSVREFIGTPAQRVALLASLYTYDEEPASLVQWARRQADVADPLSQWSRDELMVAFREFCMERDSALRHAAALVKQKAGPAALERVLADLPDAVRPAMLAALRRPI